MNGLSKNTLCPEVHRSKNAFHPMGEISDRDATFLSFMSYSAKMCQETNSRFRTKRFAYVQKMARMTNPKGRDKAILK